MNINLINCLAGIVQFWLYYYSLHHCLLLFAFFIFIWGFGVLFYFICCLVSLILYITTA